MASRVTSVLLVPVMLLASLTPAHAQPEGDAGDEAAVQDQGAGEQPLAPEVEQAKQLFNEGATKFETADYAGAIELWTEAYGIVPNHPEYAAIKAKLITNLASAQQQAYEVDKQVEHLNQAKILLESYGSVIEDIYLDAEERDKELAWVAERVGNINTELQAVAEREAAAQAQRDANQNQSSEGPQRPSGRGFVIGGSVLGGLGVAGLGVMAAGMAIGIHNNDISDLASSDIDNRAARFQDGRLGNALALAGGIGGGVLLAAGVALLIVGVKKNKAAAEPERAQVSVVPTLAPGAGLGAGLGVSGRF